MSIRLKIILIVLPLVVAALLLTGVSSYFAASNGISRVAREFLAFKALQLRKHAESQWSLLVENGLTGRSEMVDATREAVAAYATSLATSTTELTAAFGADGSVLRATGELALASGEQERVAALAQEKNTDYLTVALGGVRRVGKGFWFEPFGWYVLVTEDRAAFYAGVNEIAWRTLIILGVAIAAAVVLVLVFAGWLTRPLKRIVGTMRRIIETNDLGERVEVEYDDEIGQLAQTFNLMVDGLEAATKRVRRYAEQSAVSQQRENKVGNVFQMYVPKAVIDQVLGNPQTIIGGGENRMIAVLSSDIRGFTSISEKITDPKDLVEQLNRYFELMVKKIIDHGGIVEEFVGDAIKALFGAIEKHADDELQAALSALEMIEALEEFNRERAAGSDPWRIGVGVTFGLTTVGNVGCQRKVKFAAFGPVADFAAELEGSTKKYRQQVIVSGSIYRKLVKDEEYKLPCRMIDFVRAGGAGPAARIYTVSRTLPGVRKQAWEVHNAAMEEYYPNRNFANAIKLFTQVQKLEPEDFLSGMMLERCRKYERQEPPLDWDGAVTGETA